MGDSYIGIAKQIMDIADKIEQKTISFADIPFDAIITIIRNIYQNRGEAEDYFIKLYGEIITKGLEYSDYEIVANIFRVLAQHIVIFTVSDTRISDGTIQKYKMQSQIGHLKNREKNSKSLDVKDRSIPFEGKGVVYSAITGNYDNVKAPEFVNPEWDYILFTNNPNITSDIWEVRFLENKEMLDNVRLARHVKIMGHEYLSEYDYSIWVDGKLRIKDNLRECIEKYRRKEPLLCFNHYINDCIYKEFEMCVAMKKDDPLVMERQMMSYKDENYPEHNGMIDSAILIREINNEKLHSVMETWWNQVRNGSRRDQLSFNYACWKNDFLYDTTDLYIYGNKYVELYGHN